MDHKYKFFGLAFASTTHLLGIFIAGFLVEGWLREHYPIDFEWANIVYPLVFLGIVHSLFVLIKGLLVLEKKMKSNDD